MDTTQIDAYIMPNWAGVTEQLRFRNQWMFWPETVAKRNTKFGTFGTYKNMADAMSDLPPMGLPRCVGRYPNSFFFTRIVALLSGAKPGEDLETR